MTKKNDPTKILENENSKNDTMNVTIEEVTKFQNGNCQNIIMKLIIPEKHQIKIKAPH